MANNPGGGVGYGGFEYRGAGASHPPPPPRQRSSHWGAWSLIVLGFGRAFLTAPGRTVGEKLRWIGGRLLGMVAIFYTIVFAGQALSLGISVIPGQLVTVGVILGLAFLVTAVRRDWPRLLVSTRKGRITLIVLGVVAVWTLLDMVEPGLGVKVALVALIAYKVHRWHHGGPFP